MSIEDLGFPDGLRLLARWQAGEPGARGRLAGAFTAGLSGDHDVALAGPAPDDAVHVCGSIDLLSLGIVFDLFGLTAEELYKGDPERYVRSVMVTLRLLGMPKSYLSWPVYGFTAEALGQEMIYSDRFSPGTDPEVTLVDAGNWRDLPPLDLAGEIPALLDETLAFYRGLTGFRPVLHLSAPYSLAADIFGQEHLINALTEDPAFVNGFLDHLADTVHRPWAEHFFAQHPDGWLELSDASGSPFFIGPGNCSNVAIRSAQRLIAENPWGERVYVANYRGDYVTRAKQRGGSPGRRRRPKGESAESVTLDDLFDLKNSVCRDYVIRLADDCIPVDFYVEKAIERKIPLFTGIGATQIDRNSVVDLETAVVEIKELTRDYVDAIGTVARSIAVGGYDSRVPPWPGTVYFEDVSAESSFELIEAIVGTVLAEGTFQKDKEGSGQPDQP